jgi:hypothetical protein
MESVLSSLEELRISKSCSKICVHGFIAFFCLDPFTLSKSIERRPSEYFDVLLIFPKLSLTHCSFENALSIAFWTRLSETSQGLCLTNQSVAAGV